MQEFSIKGFIWHTCFSKMNPPSPLAALILWIHRTIKCNAGDSCSLGVEHTVKYFLMPKKHDDGTGGQTKQTAAMVYAICFS